MKIKRFLSIVVVLLLLVSSTTSVFANEGYVTLKFGGRGNDVIRLQQELKNKGYYTGSVDGIFRIRTENAVINFQRDYGLAIDGMAGRQTLPALYNSSTISGGTSPSGTSYSQDDLYWLSRIIEAEAAGEPYDGKVAVGSVVLNRVKSNEFPNTIHGVIFEYYGSIPQFSPVAEGTIYNTPSEESINAAKDALNGAKPVGNSTYFFNPAKAAGSWIVKNKTYVTRISGHTFYA